MIKKKYNSVDVFKFIVSFLIISIHAGDMFANCAPMKFFYVDIVARIGVPFFFAASGFLFCNSFKFDENGRLAKCKENLDVLKKYFIRIVILYAVWSFIYFWIAMAYNYDGISVNSIIDFAITSVKDCSYYHLWYVYALVFAYPILYLLMRVLPTPPHSLVAISALLYVIGMLLNSYSFAVEKFHFLSVISQFPFYNLFISVFCRAIPLMTVGIIACLKPMKNSNKSFGLAIVMFIMMTLEICVLNYIIKTDSSLSYLIFSIPLAYFLFDFIRGLELNINQGTAKNLRNMSTLIYCIHPIFVTILNNSININATALYVIVCILSLISSLIIVKLSKIKKLNFIKYLY